MPDYQCYGLRVRSEVPLPELVECEVGGVADVTIQRAGLADQPAQDFEELRPGRLWRGPAAMRLHLAGVAAYEVSDGRRIVVDPDPQADPDEIRLFLLGTCFGALLQQRGLLVLHGNSVRIGDACAVVVGHSGAGKSTLAAEFVRLGYDLLADDVVPVDADLCALPGFPKIKLWADAAARFGLDVTDLRRVRQQDEKYHVPFERPTLSPLPVRWVYALEKSEGTALSIEPVAGVAGFGLLWQHSYRPQLLQGFATRAEHLARCSRVQEQVRLARVHRPAATMTPAATAAAIIEDIARHPAKAVNAVQPEAQEAR